MQSITTKTMSIALSAAIILCGFNVVFNVFEFAKADIIIYINPEDPVVNQYINFEITTPINYDADYVEWYWDFDNNLDDYERVVNSGYGENLPYAVHNYSEAKIYRVHVKIHDNGHVMIQDLHVAVYPAHTTEILQALYDETFTDLKSDIVSKESSLFSGEEINSMELTLNEGLYINDNEEIDLSKFFGDDFSSVIDDFFNSDRPKSDIISDLEDLIDQNQYLDFEHVQKYQIEGILAEGIDFEGYTIADKDQIIDFANEVQDTISSDNFLPTILDYVSSKSGMTSFEFIVTIIMAGLLGGILNYISAPLHLIVGLVTSAVVAIAVMIFSLEAGFASTIGGWVNSLLIEPLGFSLSADTKAGIGALFIFGAVFGAYISLYSLSSIFSFFTGTVDCIAAIAFIVYLLTKMLVKPGKISINEVSTNPLNGNTWIELYNTMEYDKSLCGCIFSINGQDICTTNCGEIRAGEYILVSFDEDATDVDFDSYSTPRNLIVPSNDIRINDYDEITIHAVDPNIGDIIIDNVTINAEIEGKEGEDTDFKSYSACPDGGDEFKVADWSPGAENNCEGGGGRPVPIPVPIGDRPLLRLILNWIFDKNPDAFPILRHLLGL